ncbi:MAG: type II toxin-antitoxin system RelE/ParE family toxin [Clostridia bacterium]|nr:type II toxin-antitoxin system RelE/ParE family toxin [Clostridia bacterium]
MSKTYKTIILPEAQQDIRNIVLYIARELAAPQAALDLEKAFREEILSLRENPERIKTVDEQPWKDAGIRKTRVKNYYIYFLIDDAEMSVKVNAVIYVKRDQVRQMIDRGMTGI